jgi:hypothetical protein
MNGRPESWMHTPFALNREKARAREPGVNLDLPVRKTGYAHCEGCQRYRYAGGRVNKGWRCASCKTEKPLEH